jgi:hypothetical protein
MSRRLPAFLLDFNDDFLVMFHKMFVVFVLFDSLHFEMMLLRDAVFAILAGWESRVE